MKYIYYENNFIPLNVHLFTKMLGIREDVSQKFIPINDQENVFLVLDNLRDGFPACLHITVAKRKKNGEEGREREGKEKNN